MVNYQKGSTSGTILVILLVVVVGFVVWYATSNREMEPEPAVELNLGAGDAQ